MSRALKTLGIFFAFLVILTLSRHAISPSSTSTTTQASTSSTSTTTAGTATCTAGDFRGVFNQGQGAAGTVYASVSLVKDTSGTCTLKGWPMLTLLDRTGAVLPSTTIDLPTTNSPIQFPITQANTPPTTLALHDGSRTDFSLAYSDVPRGTEVCPSATTLAVQLVHNGPVVDVTAQYPVQPCNNGAVWVSPFY
ncbi:MAG TPA: DUF4232 domain-containing protein [Acidimicrobiales bacterium]|nr:DUF4232 domain-containing protein [Acidimicrobiales bacterium]